MLLNKKLLSLIFTLSIASNAFTCTEDGTKGIVEDNDLYISVDSKMAKSGITEEVFNSTIDKVEEIYAPIISSMGATLKVARNWTDGTVNAFASRSGNTWNVSMFGGLARHETITADGFALVVCHEVGHHIGGAPKKGSIWGSSWASNEGQSDYFATLKCLRKAFLNDDNESIVRSMVIPQALSQACETQYKSNDLERLICIRGAMAGMSVSRLFKALRSAEVEPDFATPDSRVVTSTDHNHPAYQCRLDTYFQGALCLVDDNTDVSQTDEKVGVCHPLNGDTVGLRPSCWMKHASR